MELSVIMTIMMLCIIETQRVTAKSNPFVFNSANSMRYPQKQITVSTTMKPDVQYHNAQQYHNAKSENQQSHFPQNLPVIPQQVQQLTLQPIQYHQPMVHQVPLPFQTQLHPQSQQQILQLIQKVLYNTQQSNQPTAMIIIAQPAYASPAVFGNTAQQLMNYFSNNPQARYQFVQGPLQSQPISQYISQPQLIQSSPSISYPVLPAAAQYQSQPQTTHMLPVQSSETYGQQLPQFAAQQYHPEAQMEIQPSAKQNGDAAYSSSLPPIITGFENFSPEQQEKIKAQLSKHFGAPLQPLTLNKKDSDTINKYHLNTNEFIPSAELKSGKSGTNVMSVAKNAFTKV